MFITVSDTLVRKAIVWQPNDAGVSIVIETHPYLRDIWTVYNDGVELRGLFQDCCIKSVTVIDFGRKADLAL